MSGWQRISSMDEAVKLLRKGWQLGGCAPDYFLVSPDGSGQRGVWLNAARGCLKRTDVQQVVFRDDEGARWQMMAGSA